jgi:hypothetical protein
VTVNGQQGWWAPGEHVDPNPPDETLPPNDPWAAVADTPDDQPELAWRNHGGSWSMLMGTVGFDPSTYDFDNQVARHVMFDMAKAVSIGDTDEALAAPFSITMEPRFRPIIISARRGIACVDWTRSHSTFHVLPQQEVMVCRAPTTLLDDPATPSDSPLHCPGSSYCPLQRRDLGDGTALIIGVDNLAAPDVLTAAQQRQLLDQADVSPSFNQPSTWLPV